MENNETEKTAEAILEFSIYVTCPYCEEVFDVTNQDDDHSITAAIFTNKWDRVKGCLVICVACDKEFTISEVVY